jgi:hypothetical protein
MVFIRLLTFIFKAFAASIYTLMKNKALVKALSEKPLFGYSRESGSPEMP